MDRRLLLVLIATLTGCKGALAPSYSTGMPASMKKESTEYAQTRDRGIEALKRSLKDPYSAVVTADTVDPDTNVVCGTVNAKNGFGGYTGETAFVVNGSQVTLLSGDAAAFGKEFNATCKKTLDKEIAWNLADAKRLNAQAAALGNSN